MELISIEEHNERVRHTQGNLTGVACPNCGNELQYEDKHIAFLSSPMQYAVQCYKCNYKGKIY